MSRRRKRYSRPDYRWTDDLDVIIGLAGLVGALVLAVAQARGVSIIPNL